MSKKSAATKKDIIPVNPAKIRLKRIHAIVLGLDCARPDEQLVIAACIAMMAGGIPMNATKVLSADERMTLSRLAEEGEFEL